MSDRPAKKPRLTRAAFKKFVPMPTRWDDNDVFGHVNNVRYYAYFDTAVTRVEIEAGIFNTSRDNPCIPYVVESNCTYFEGVAFPEALEVGVGIERIGNSSVSYRLALFREGGDIAVAQGTFIHVYVDSASEKPVPLPAKVRAFAQGLEI